jgi:hypothetical protein
MFTGTILHSSDLNIFMSMHISKLANIMRAKIIMFEDSVPPPSGISPCWTVYFFAPLFHKCMYLRHRNGSIGGYDSKTQNVHFKRAIFGSFGIEVSLAPQPSVLGF